MIRAVGNKRLFLLKSEFDVYNNIAEEIGKESFIDTFDSDNNGTLLAVFSAKKTDSMVIQFLYNIMINQRVRSMDKKLIGFQARIEKIEKSMEKE